MEGMLRHMVLNSIRMYYKKHTGRYGELVIACESRSHWRKQIFPYYKASRKKGRDESPLDWDKFFRHFDTIKGELREFFPYRVVQYEGAEADDVIGTLTKRAEDQVLIISNDHDFIQLHNFNVTQISPIGNDGKGQKKTVSDPNPDLFKVQHIIGGDKGDGIPNILSGDDWLVTGKRQGTMTAQRLAKYTDFAMGKGEWDDQTIYRNYKRNEALIDLDLIPEDVTKGVVAAYEAEAGKDGSRIYDYFVSRRLRNLMENINEFD